MKYPDFIIKIDEILAKVGLNLYVVMIAIGIIVLVEYAIFVLEKQGGYSRAATNKLLIFIALALASAYVFAALFDAVFHYFQTGIFEFGPITFIGGLIGGVAMFVLLVSIFYREERKNILKLLNLLIPGVVLAHAFGRIGCFTAGCCYGKPTESVFGILFPPGTNPYADGILIPIHPTQLYEAFFLFALFFVLAFVPKVKEHKFAAYLIGYGIFRFFMEKFLRDDPRGLLFGLPPSLLLSALLTTTGIGILVYTFIYSKRTSGVQP
ncbi:MAG TPA: hypothetical protein GX390_02815 [Acholeplasmataceae bacterium]|jgi:phosphatidylglycerol:prolipoprotein diacylglycerol transferase|nr:hypothetical protein [Acholeplasmataceae bacterium]